jgi:hypothetical protein
MPEATRADAPNNAVTAPESPASSSALPCAVSITPGPDKPKRACGMKSRCAHAAASTDAPPNALPVTIASVAMPTRLTSNNARSARASAHSAALASCKRHAAGIDEQNNGIRTFIEGALEQMLQQCAVLRTDAAAQEPRVLRRCQDPCRAHCEASSHDAIGVARCDAPTRPGEDLRRQRAALPCSGVRERGQSCQRFKYRDLRHACRKAAAT